MKHSSVAKRYARALADIAMETGAVQKVSAQVSDVLELWNTSADFREVMQSPGLLAQRHEVMPAIHQRLGLDRTMVSFLDQVLENDRMAVLPEIVSEFFRLVEEAQGQLRAEVTSAVPLSDVEKTKIAVKLGQKVGKKIIVDEHVDPSFIGGLVIKLKDEVIDGSVKTQLSKVRQALAKER